MRFPSVFTSLFFAYLDRGKILMLGIGLFGLCQLAFAQSLSYQVSPSAILMVRLSPGLELFIDGTLINVPLYAELISGEYVLLVPICEPIFQFARCYWLPTDFPRGLYGATLYYPASIEPKTKRGTVQLLFEKSFQAKIIFTWLETRDLSSEPGYGGV